MQRTRRPWAINLAWILKSTEQSPYYHAIQEHFGWLSGGRSCTWVMTVCTDPARKKRGSGIWKFMKFLCPWTRRLYEQILTKCKGYRHLPVLRKHALGGSIHSTCCFALPWLESQLVPQQWLKPVLHNWLIQNHYACWRLQMMMRTLKVFKIMLEKTSSIALISRACEEAERKAQRAHFPDQSQMNHRPFIADRCICFAPEIFWRPQSF